MSGNRGAFSSLPEMALPTQNKYTLNNEEKGQRNHFWPLQSGSFMRNTEERRFLSKLSLDFVMKFFRFELYMLPRLFSKKYNTQ